MRSAGLVPVSMRLTKEATADLAHLSELLGWTQRKVVETALRHLRLSKGVAAVAKANAALFADGNGGEP